MKRINFGDRFIGPDNKDLAWGNGDEIRVCNTNFRPIAETKDEWLRVAVDALTNQLAVHNSTQSNFQPEYPASN
jgi:hypothetical protein